MKWIKWMFKTGIGIGIGIIITIYAILAVMLGCKLYELIRSFKLWERLAN